AARPAAPERRTRSTSTVGLPRLSRIWRAWTFSIWLIVLLPGGSLGVQPRLGVEGELVLGRARGAQRELGIDAQLARDVDRREQDVADLVEQRVADVVGRGGAGLGVRAGG